VRKRDSQVTLDFRGTFGTRGIVTPASFIPTANLARLYHPDRTIYEYRIGSGAFSENGVTMVTYELEYQDAFFDFPAKDQHLLSCKRCDVSFRAPYPTASYSLQVIPPKGKHLAKVGRTRTIGSDSSVLDPVDIKGAGPYDLPLLKDLKALELLSVYPLFVPASQTKQP
jgi:hypothetical protein